MIRTLPRRGRVFSQQAARGYQHARRAKAALVSAMLQKSFLQGIELTVGFAQAFDRHDLAARGRDGQYQARQHRLPVHLHGARAAFADTAAVLSAGQLEVLTQHVQQQVVGCHPNVARPPLTRNSISRVRRLPLRLWAVLPATAATGFGGRPAVCDHAAGVRLTTGAEPIALARELPLCPPELASPSGSHHLDDLTPVPGARAYVVNGCDFLGCSHGRGIGHSLL